MIINPNIITRGIALTIKKVINPKRDPDFVIGGHDDPYMLRWYLIRTRFGSVYLHEFIHSDNDVHHDHPWSSASVALGYVKEHGGSMTEELGTIARPVLPGTMVFRRADFAHRIVVTKPGFRTLFFIGPKWREWGFHCPKGWVSWKKFVLIDKKGSNVAGGCGDMS
jgi:hypothetical protein